MRKSLHFGLLLCLTVLNNSWTCSRQVATQVAQVRLTPTSASTPPIAQSPAPITQANSDEEVGITDAFVEGDKLTYEGYVIQKRYKKIKLDYPWEMKAPPLWVEVSYAVLTRKRRFIKKFDGGIYFGAGNSTTFGLFSFLGHKTKQLVVSQDVFRGGTQWVASLSPHFHIIFDGPAWGVGREADDMGVIDLDADGVLEITVPITAFYGISEWLPTGRTPLPLVIFKYDAKARAYLPANLQFQDYLLKDIDNKRRNVSPPDDRINHLSDILPIVLDYIFAGKEQEAWTFYAASYKLPDRKELKSKIRAVLITQPVYRFIYKRTSVH